MNFQTDGTSLVQILKDNSFFWGDNGLCYYGKIYDPSTGLCRDVFCSDGYDLTDKGCAPDPHEMNSTKHDTVRKHHEIKIELTVAHRLCLYKIGFNETVNCHHKSIIRNEDYFLASLKFGLKSLLSVNLDRLDEMKINSRIIINNEISGNYTETSERIEVSLLIRDNKKFTNDKIESLTLYFWLISLTMQRETLNMLDHEVELVKVVEEKNATNHRDWCQADGDTIHYYNSKNDLRILASFDEADIPKYYVYIKETESLYATGEF